MKYTHVRIANAKTGKFIKNWIFGFEEYLQINWLIN